MGDKVQKADRVVEDRASGGLSGDFGAVAAIDVHDERRLLGSSSPAPGEERIRLDRADAVLSVKTFQDQKYVEKLEVSSQRVHFLNAPLRSDLESSLPAVRSALRFAADLKVERAQIVIIGPELFEIRGRDANYLCAGGTVYSQLPPADGLDKRAEAAREALRQANRELNQAVGELKRRGADDKAVQSLVACARSGDADLSGIDERYVPLAKRALTAAKTVATLQNSFNGSVDAASQVELAVVSGPDRGQRARLWRAFPRIEEVARARDASGEINPSVPLLDGRRAESHIVRLDRDGRSTSLSLIGADGAVARPATIESLLRSVLIERNDSDRRNPAIREQLLPSLLALASGERAFGLRGEDHSEGARHELSLIYSQMTATQPRIDRQLAAVIDTAFRDVKASPENYESSSHGRRSRLVNDLGRLLPGAESALVAIVTDRRSTVLMRSVAAEALAGRRGEEFSATSLRALAGCHPNVDQDAALAIGRGLSNAHHPLAFDVLKTILESKAHDTNKALAAAAMGDLRTERSDRYLIELFGKAGQQEIALSGFYPTNTEMRQALARYVMDKSPNRIYGRSETPTGYRDVVEKIIPLLAQDPDRLGVQALTVLARDPSVRVRRLAEHALFSIHESRGVDVEAAVRALRDEEGGRRGREAAKADLDLILSCWRHGIRFPGRFPVEAQRQLVEMRENPAPRRGEKVALAIYPTDDHNGAFHTDEAIVPLLARGYRVIFHEARTVNDVKAALTGAAKIGGADALILSGHGHQTGIRFGSSALGDSSELRTSDRLSPYGAALKPDGVIVVRSCSTGRGETEQPNNIGNYLRREFPHTKPEHIFTPIEDARFRGLKFDRENRIIDAEYNVPRYRSQIERPPGPVSTA